MLRCLRIFLSSLGIEFWQTMRVPLRTLAVCENFAPRLIFTLFINYVFTVIINYLRTFLSSSVEIINYASFNAVASRKVLRDKSNVLIV